MEQVLKYKNTLYYLVQSNKQFCNKIAFCYKIKGFIFIFAAFEKQNYT